MKQVISTPHSVMRCFPPNILRALKLLEQIPSNPNYPIDDVSYGVAKEWGKHQQQYIIGDQKDHYNIVYSFYQKVGLREWMVHTNQALLKSGIKFVRQVKTILPTRGDLRQWYHIDDSNALVIQRIPRGGFGIICTDIAFMEDQCRIATEMTNLHQMRMQLIASAKSKLTPDEIKALRIA